MSRVNVKYIRNLLSSIGDHKKWVFRVDKLSTDRHSVVMESFDSEPIGEAWSVYSKSNNSFAFIADAGIENQAKPAKATAKLIATLFNNAEAMLSEIEYLRAMVKNETP